MEATLSCTCQDTSTPYSASPGAKHRRDYSEKYTSAREGLSTLWPIFSATCSGKRQSGMTCFQHRAAVFQVLTYFLFLFCTCCKYSTAGKPSNMHGAAFWHECTGLDNIIGACPSGDPSGSALGKWLTRAHCLCYHSEKKKITTCSAVLYTFSGALLTFKNMALRRALCLKRATGSQFCQSSLLREGHSQCTAARAGIVKDPAATKGEPDHFAQTKAA